MATELYYGPEESKELNRLFVESTRTHEGKEKVAMTQVQEVEDRLREESFSEKIVTPRGLQPSELRESMKTDGPMCFVVQMEHTGQRAATVSFRNKPDVALISAPRFEVGVYKISSEVYTYEEDEIEAYQTPIVQKVRKNITNDMSEVQDRNWLVLSESATQATQKYKNGIAFSSLPGDTTCFSAYNVAAGTCLSLGKIKGVDALASYTGTSAAAGVTETTTFAMQKDDLIKLQKAFVGTGSGVGDRLALKTVLVGEYDMLDVASWTNTDLGDKLPGDMAMNGVKTNTLLGLNIVRSIKSDILRPGNIYGFTDEKFLGGIRTKGAVRWWTETKKTWHTFEAWRSLGMYIANIPSVRKLELYCGSVDEKSGTDNAAVKALYAPVAEAALGAKNNLVLEGGLLPVITDY